MRDFAVCRGMIGIVGADGPWFAAPRLTVRCKGFHRARGPEPVMASAILGRVPDQPSTVATPPRRGAVLRRLRRSQIVVLGDLLLDAVLEPERPLVRATDVAGRVLLRQGGSAATTARWLARLGARTRLICAVGRDAIGRALVESVSRDRVNVRATRVSGAPTGRIGVLVGPDGERSFVTDRGAADRLTPDDLHADWFQRTALFHLPAYSLLGEPVGSAASRALEMARNAGGLVSVDLASTRPLLASGRRRAAILIRRVAADLLFATGLEADALVGAGRVEDMLEIAPIVVIKRGREGATVLALEGTTRLRFEVATRPLAVTDTTGAGDAFDAGFIVSWLASLGAGSAPVGALQRATLAGHRAAARHLTGPRPELVFR
jgi:sugar/nucleoside kinase (ribokinase family)